MAAERWRVEVSKRALRWLEEDCAKRASDRVKIRAGFTRVFKLLAEAGPYLGLPHAVWIREYRMWEARYEHRGTCYRMFYCQEGAVFLVAGGVVKKKRRLAPGELRAARRWCDEAIVEWQREGGEDSGSG
jgi:hypothetical protein